MTLASAVVQSSGASTNGATVTFSFGFRVQSFGAITAAEQVKVVLCDNTTGVETVLTRTTHYTVSVNADQDSSPGGSITTVSTYASGYTLYIKRNPTYLQSTDLTPQGPYSAATVETTFDQAVMQIQDLLDRQKGSPSLGVQKGSTFDGAISGSLTGKGGFGVYLKESLLGFELLEPASANASVTPSGATDGRTQAAWEGDVVNVMADWGGGKATGNGVTNDAAAIQAAFTYASSRGKTVVFPPGTYIINSSISLGVGYNLSVHIMPGAILDFSGASISGGNCLVFGDTDTGSTEKAEPSVSPARFDRTITFATDQGFAVGDIGIVWNDADYSWVTSDTYFKSGDMFRVVSTGATIGIDAPLSDSYNISGSIRCIKLTPGYLHIFGGGEIRGKQGATNGVIAIVDGVDVKVEDIRVSGGRASLIFFKRCWRPIVSKVSGWDDQTDVNANYGVWIVSCHEPLIDGCNIRTKRHSVTLSAGQTLASIPTRRGRVANCELKSDGNSGALDMHGSSDECVFENNTVYGAINLAGRSPKLNGGRVYTCDVGGSAGCAIFLRELYDANVSISNLTIHITDAVNAYSVINLDMSTVSFASTITGTLVLDGIQIIDKQGVSQVMTAALPISSAELISLKMSNVHYERVGDANNTSGTLTFNNTAAQTVTFSSSSGLLMTAATDIASLTSVTFTNSGGALPTGLSAGTTYWTVRVSATTSRLATSLANASAGTVIAYTDAGTGTTSVSGTSIWRAIELENVTGLNRAVATDLKATFIRDVNGSARYTAARGVDWRLAPHSARQIIMLRDFKTSQNSREGVSLGGQNSADASSQITVDCQGCYSDNNDRGSASTIDYAYKILNCDRVIFQGNHSTSDTARSGDTVTFDSSSGLRMTTPADYPTYSAVRFTNSGGALPTGLSAGTTYYTVRVDSTRSKLATSLINAIAGTVISYTDAGTGTTSCFLYTGNSFSTIGSLLWRNNSRFDSIGVTDNVSSITAYATGSELYGSATYDPASLADGAGATTTVTVNGAALGDYVTGVSFSNDLQGTLLTGYVSASNTVSVRFQDEAGGHDLSSGTIKVRVLKA